MKPILLEMTAFGPYKNTEKIDFRKLEENLLFAIAGKTGAGKTTIFDGICYALYGEASGEDRSEWKNMRSHFADEDTPTSVAFSFALKNKEYYISRVMPQQKQGNKSLTKGKVEFYEIVAGEKVSILESNRANEVKEKVQSLLGLTKEQFSQIVMLPQGEFGRLLTSETENKEEILGKIFQTVLYRKIQETLDNKRKNAESNVKDKKLQLDIYYSQLADLAIREQSPLAEVVTQDYKEPHQVLKALQEEHLFYEGKLFANREKVGEEESQLQKKNEQLQVGKQLNEQFRQLAECERQLGECRKQEGEMKEKEQTIALARKAEQLAIFQELFQKAVELREGREKELEEVSGRLADFAEKLASMKEVYEEEKSKSSVREEKKSELKNLELLKDLVTNLAEQEQALQQLADEVKGLQGSEEKLTEEISRTQLTLIEEKLFLQKLTAKLAELPQKSKRRGELLEDFHVLKKYLTTKEQVNTLEEKAEKARVIYEKELAIFQVEEEKWLSNQAAILATHLRDGSPCQVCGSLEHPNKAHGNEGEDNQKFTKAKEQKEQAEKLAITKQAELGNALALMESSREEVVKQGYLVERAEESYRLVLEEGKILKTEIAQLETLQESYNEKKSQVEKMEDAIANFQEQLKALPLQEKQLELATKKATFESQRNQLPKKMKTVADWQSKHKEVKGECTKLEKSWQQAETDFHQMTKEKALLEQSYHTTATLHEEAKAKKQEETTRFQKELIKAGFENSEKYNQAVLTQVEMDSLQEEINAFHDRVKVLAIETARLHQLLVGKEKVDIHLLEHEVKVLAEQLNNLKRENIQTETLLEQFANIASKIETTSQEWKKAEHMTGQIRDVYDVVRGDNKSYISFERYVLLEYLERIIEIANLRLIKLSNGQFRLQRSERIEKGNKQSGLGLDVYDEYTGQMRDVKTLSGGEKFNASLCLALGMVDVIQNFAGGISIEMMFIDEGFGSLDEESLEKAINTLVELQQSGRMIGVISHVQELNNAMPAVLHVRKTKEGYSKTEIRLKN